MAPKSQRMSAEDRRRAIIRSVVPVFARKGFRGATTRELAAAAGVSEALLYRHFPSKESLYAAIGSQHLDDPRSHPGLDQLLAMKPSTKRLVHTVYYLLVHIARSEPTDFPRLMAHSALGDGDFAESVLTRFVPEYTPFFEASIQAARKSLDLDSPPPPAPLAAWFIHHLAFSMKLFALPGRSLVDYGRSCESTILEAVRFCLRGIGIKTGAIRKFVKQSEFAHFQL